jgi:magnesium transporter
MTLSQDLAASLMRSHPERAALVLDSHEAAGSVDTLNEGAEVDAAEVLRRLSPQRAEQVLTSLPRVRAAALLARLELGEAARLMRSLEASLRTELEATLDARRARALRALLSFREGTAGALMDPQVLALPRGLQAAEALERVRAEPEHARYNLYVIDEEQRLVGALNLRELFLAEPTRKLGELMVAAPQRLPADAESSQVVSHPGWKEVHSLPVVDDQGRYLGAVRYRKLRQLERALLSARRDDQDTSSALGQLFAAGAGGLFEALGGSGAPNEGQRHGR